MDHYPRLLASGLDLSSIPDWHLYRELDTLREALRAGEVPIVIWCLESPEEIVPDDWYRCLQTIWEHRQPVAERLWEIWRAVWPVSCEHACQVIRCVAWSCRGVLGEQICREALRHPISRERLLRAIVKARRPDLLSLLEEEGPLPHIDNQTVAATGSLELCRRLLVPPLPGDGGLRQCLSTDHEERWESAEYILTQIQTPTSRTPHQLVPWVVRGCWEELRWCRDHGLGDPEGALRQIYGPDSQLGDHGWPTGLVWTEETVCTLCLQASWPTLSSWLEIGDRRLTGEALSDNAGLYRPGETLSRCLWFRTDPVCQRFLDDLLQGVVEGRVVRAAIHHLGRYSLIDWWYRRLTDPGEQRAWLLQVCSQEPDYRLYFWAGTQALRLGETLTWVDGPGLRIDPPLARTVVLWMQSLGMAHPSSYLQPTADDVLELEMTPARYQRQLRTCHDPPPTRTGYQIMACVRHYQKPSRKAPGWLLGSVLYRDNLYLTEAEHRRLLLSVIRAMMPLAPIPIMFLEGRRYPAQMRSALQELGVWPSLESVLSSETLHQFWGTAVPLQRQSLCRDLRRLYPEARIWYHKGTLYCECEGELTGWHEDPPIYWLGETVDLVAAGERWRRYRGKSARQPE